jgi:hypothetical protein
MYSVRISNIIYCTRSNYVHVLRYYNTRECKVNITHKVPPYSFSCSQARIGFLKKKINITNTRYIRILKPDVDVTVKDIDLVAD